nr:MAG TPA: hypothetical protein [Crassvirales sp.]
MNIIMSNRYYFHFTILSKYKYTCSYKFRIILKSSSIVSFTLFY